MRPLLLAALFILCQACAGEVVVVIDPGHGGPKNTGSEKERTFSSSNNATSPSGLKEKDLTLELSLEVVKQIRALAEEHPGKTIRPVLTRTTDENPDFARRAAICAAAKPTVIFSIHFNASDDHAGLGTVAMVGTEKRNPNSKADRKFASGLVAAANSAVKVYLPASKPRSCLTDDYLHGGLGSNFFYQMARHPQLAKVPKCFLEVEFIDRADVDNGLLKRRKEAFPGIARAIALYLYTLDD